MSRLPSTGPSLQRYLRQQARTAQRQQQSSAFNLSGTSVVAENVTEVDGTLNVVGNLNVSGPAVITGTLSLPAGIINNDALANPTMGQKVYASAQNFAPSTTLTTVLTTTITVPAGFTTADVDVIARVYAINPNTTGGSNGAGADYLNVRPSIASFDGFGLQLATGGSNGSNINVAPVATVLTGLTPGGTFNVTAKVVTMFLAWGANTDNTVILSGLISWGR